MIGDFPYKIDEQLQRAVIPATFFVHTATYDYQEQLLTILGEMAVSGQPGKPRRFEMTFTPDDEHWSVGDCLIWPEGE